MPKDPKVESDTDAQQPPANSFFKPRVLVILLAVVAVLTTLLFWAIIKLSHRKTQTAQSTQIGTNTQQSTSTEGVDDGKTKQIVLTGAQGNTSIQVEVASSEASREKGLSGRDSLAPNTGMLFVFGSEGYDCFWMKDMKFDIDMLWFDQNQNLVYMQENASKSTYPSSFCPQTAAKYVLELPAGTAKQLGLQLGDHFSQP